MSAVRPGAAPPPTFQPLAADDPHEVGGYRVFARLGAGGMGWVYLSYTPGGRPVALKVIRPELAQDGEFRHRFAQEVAAAQRIHGLYTAQVVDAGVDAATPWLATAYVPGPSLHQVVLQHGPLPERTVLLLMAGIAEALQAIHGVDVVHRDLKPANVLIAADGPRVIDFGIARAAGAGELTGTGLRIGSPAFMAPEQALGRPVGPATDVFALGALAAYVAGGTTPFGTGPDSAALYRTVHEEPDLARVPAGLHGLIRHCLAKHPEDRPTTGQVIEAARNHLAVGGQLRFAEDWLPDRITDELTRRATPPEHTVLLPHPTRVQPPTEAPAHPPSSGPRRTRTALLITAALLAGAAAAFVLLDSPDDGSDQTTPPAASPPTPTPPGYTAIYTGTELTSPDHTYEFDIRTGKVTPQETATWYLGRSATDFYLPEDSTAYLAPDGPLTPADCVKGTESAPVTTLPFSALPPGRSFCVRAHSGRELAIVRVLSTAPDDGPVQISLDYYRHDN